MSNVPNDQYPYKRNPQTIQQERVIAKLLIYIELPSITTGVEEISLIGSKRMKFLPIYAIIILIKFGKEIVMTKEKALEAVQTLPPLFDLEVLIERLIFIEKVEKGREESNKGILIPNEEAKLRLKRK